MDCKIPPIKAHRAGLTLIEMMVAMFVGSLVITSMLSFSLYTGRSVVSLANYADMESRSRMALDRMSTEIRQCRGLTEFTSTSLTFKDSDGASLSYVYDPSAKTLARLKNGTRDVLLEGCDYLQFGIYQRNPIGGSYDVYPAASVSTAKLIQITWGCARSILGKNANSEIVQSSKIVIRNQE